MVYSDDDDFAHRKNYKSWNEFAKANTFPSKEKLTDDRLDACALLNEWIGSWNVDITDPRFTKWLKRKEIDVILRMHAKDRLDKEGEAGITPPHDMLFEYERKKLMNIGKLTGYRVSGMVG